MVFSSNAGIMIKEVISIMPDVKETVFFSDGATIQFKNRYLIEYLMIMGANDLEITVRSYVYPFLLSRNVSVSYRKQAGPGNEISKKRYRTERQREIERYEGERQKNYRSKEHGQNARGKGTPHHAHPTEI